MRYETTPVVHFVKLYGEHPHNYIGTCVLMTFGDVGWMALVSSPMIYRAGKWWFNRLLDEHGLNTLEGYTEPRMARVLERISRSYAKFQIVKYGTCAGREMPWIVLSRKD